MLEHHSTELSHRAPLSWWYRQAPITQHQQQMKPSNISCSAGVVGEDGNCCTGDKPTLDSSGKCCLESLDAAGQCGGSGLVVDFAGQPCNGTLDAGGLCCPATLVVDEFGVCAGNSSSGLIALTFDILASSNQGEHALMQSPFSSILPPPLSITIAYALSSAELIGSCWLGSCRLLIVHDNGGLRSGLISLFM